MLEPQKMRCIHKHTISGREVSCNTQTIITDIPIDSTKKCIFHSENNTWKKNNNFVALFSKLLEHTYKENLMSFGFHGFIFIGENLDLEYRINNILYFNKLFSKTILTFYDCLFICEVELEQCVFKEALNFINCKFSNEVTLNNCRLYDELNIFDNCHFDKKLAFYNMNIFKSNVQVVNTSFNEDLDFDNNQIHGTLHIDENNFTPDFGLYMYSNELFLGVSIRNNTGVGLLGIEENKIKNDSLLSNLNKDASIQFSNNIIYAEFKFQGIEDNLIFNPNTVFEVEKEHFTSSASRMIFDYCDLLNLNKKTLRTLTELEENEKVVFNDTNKMTRLRIIHIVENRDIPEYILTDIFVLITRYFSNYFSLHLSVSFQKRITKNQTKVIFTSKQLIEVDDFHKTFTKCVKQIFQNHDKKIIPLDEYDDIIEQTKNVKHRVQNYLDKHQFTPKDLISALSLSDSNIYIQITKETIMGDKNTFNNSQIGAVGSNSKASKNSFQNINLSISENLDYTIISKELDKLKTVLVSKAKSSDNYAAISEVVSAQEAAKEKKGKKLIGHLLKAGKWTLETAKEIGVGVVADIITKQM